MVVTTEDEKVKEGKKRNFMNTMNLFSIPVSLSAFKEGPVIIIFF